MAFLPAFAFLDTFSSAADARSRQEKKSMLTEERPEMDRSSFEGRGLGGAICSCTLGHNVELNKASFTAFSLIDGRF